MLPSRKNIRRSRMGPRASAAMHPPVSTLTPKAASEQSLQDGSIDFSRFFGGAVSGDRSLRRQNFQHLHRWRDSEQVLGLGKERLGNRAGQMGLSAFFILERIEDAELRLAELDRVPGGCAGLTHCQRLSRPQKRLDLALLAWLCFEQRQYRQFVHVSLLFLFHKMRDRLSSYSRGAGIGCSCALKESAARFLELKTRGMRRQLCSNYTG